MSEASVGMVTAFGIDHFRPKSKFPQLECSYENLYYCCNDCNSYKGSAWPSDSLQLRGIYFPDPCECDPYSKHLSLRPDGLVDPLTPPGEFSLEVLRLNRETCVRVRKRRHRLKERINALRAELKRIQCPKDVRTLLEQVLAESQAELEDC